MAITITITTSRRNIKVYLLGIDLFRKLGSQHDGSSVVIDSVVDVKAIVSRVRISGHFTASNLRMISTNFCPTVGHNTSCHIVKVFAVCCDRSAKSFEGCSISPLAEVVVATISLHLPLVSGVGGQLCEGIGAVALGSCCAPVIFALGMVSEIPSRLLAAPSHGCSVGTNLDSVESGRNGAGSGFSGEVNGVAPFVGGTLRLHAHPVMGHRSETVKSEVGVFIL